jgi:hypothetical protein
MKVYTSELEFLRDEVEKCHESMHSQIQMLKDLMTNRHELQEKLKNQQERKWFGLTAEEIEEIGKPYEEKDRSILAWGLFACAIEDILKEKNCG